MMAWIGSVSIQSIKYSRKNTRPRRKLLWRSTRRKNLAHSPVISSSSGGYSSNDDEEKEYDNMRGFDPASVDDMEDNGMSRYMENNDEEGWD